MNRRLVSLATFIGIAVSFGGCGGSPQTPPPPEPMDDGPAPVVETAAEDTYVGTAECLGCHPDVAATYAQTGMGKAFFPLTPETAVEDFTRDNEIEIPGTGLRYRMIERDGRYFQRQFVPDSRGGELVVDEREVAWVLGSGKHARSYVTLVGDELFQMPMCWYPEPRLWDLCPGYEHTNEHFSREVTLSCVFCHNGRMVPRDGASNVFEPPIPHGIGCERCHGPGRAHVDRWRNREGPPSSAAETIVNPRSLPREERIQVCFQCHFGDSMTSERVHRVDRSLLDFRPGDPIIEVMMPFSLREVSEHEFGLSAQADRLIRSRCYRESEGRLECLTCHDPHVSVYSADRPSDFFTRRCLECHEVEACSASAAQRAATVPPDDCVACHMRTAEADDQRHAVFTDHWIRKRIDSPGSGEPVVVPEPLPVFPDSMARLPRGEQAFYRARANMLIAMDLPVPVRQPMWQAAEESFDEAIRSGFDNTDTWTFLGMVLDFRGRLPEAEQALARAVSHDPQSREAAFPLGAIRLRLGKLAEAESIYRRLVERDPGDVGALAELGRCALMAGRNEEALAIYDRAVPLAPTLASLRTNRGAALAKLGRFEEASAEVEKAVSLSPDDPGLWTFWAELLKRTNRPESASEADKVARRLQSAPASGTRAPGMGD